jgi:hypothetical protein
VRDFEPGESEGVVCQVTYETNAGVRCDERGLARYEC